MRDSLKKFALFVAGVGVSIFFGFFSSGTEWPTPGHYLIYKLFPPWDPPGSHDFGTVILVHIGTDSVSCFALLWIAYVLFRRVSREVKR